MQFLILKLHANRINIISALLRGEEQLDDVPFKYFPIVSGSFIRYLTAVKLKNNNREKFKQVPDKST